MPEQNELDLSGFRPSAGAPPAELDLSGFMPGSAQPPPMARDAAGIEQAGEATANRDRRDIVSRLSPDPLTQLTDDLGPGEWTKPFQISQRIGYGHLHFEKILGDPAYMQQLREETSRDYRAFVNQGQGVLAPLISKDLADRLWTGFMAKRLIDDAPLSPQGRQMAAQSGLRKLVKGFVERQQATEREAGGAPLDEAQTRALRWFNDASPLASLTLAREAWDATESPYPRFVHDNLVIASRSLEEIQGIKAAKDLFGPRWAEVVREANQGEQKLLKEALVRKRLGPDGLPESLRGFTYTPADGIAPLEFVPDKLLQNMVLESRRRGSPAFSADGLRNIPASVMAGLLVEGGRERVELPAEAVTPAELSLASPLERFAHAVGSRVVTERQGAVRFGAELLDKLAEASDWGADKVRELNVALSAGHRRHIAELEAQGIEVPRELAPAHPPGGLPDHVTPRDILVGAGRLFFSVLPGLRHDVNHPGGVMASPEQVPGQELPALAVRPAERDVILKVVNPVLEGVAFTNAEYRRKLEERLTDDARAKKEHAGDVAAYTADPRRLQPGMRALYRGFQAINFMADHLIIQPAAGLADTPEEVPVFLAENALLAKAVQGSAEAIERVIAAARNSATARIALGQLTTRHPIVARKMRNTLTRMEGAASPNQELESVVAQLRTLTEESAETAVRVDPWRLGNQLRKYWPELRADLGQIGSDIENVLAAGEFVGPGLFAQGVGAFLRLARRAGHKLDPSLYPVASFGKKVQGVVDAIIGRNLNDEAAQAVESLLNGGGETGYRALHQRRRLQLVAEALGRSPGDLDRITRLRIASGDPTFLAQMQPKLLTRLAAMDEQIAGLARSGDSAALSQAVRERERAQVVLEQWADVVPSRETLTALDLYHVVERTKYLTSLRGTTSRAIDLLYRGAFKVNRLEAEMLHRDIDALVDMTLEGSEARFAASRRLAERRVFLDRAYRLAQHKIKLKIENAELFQGLALGSLREGNLTPEGVTIAQRGLAGSKQASAGLRQALSRLENERRVLAEARPERPWRVDDAAEIRKWIKDSDVYWMMKTDPQWGGGRIPEEFFDWQPSASKPATEEIRRLEALAAKARSAPIADSVGETLRLRKQVAGAAAARAADPALQEIRVRAPTTSRKLLSQASARLAPAERRAFAAIHRHLRAPVETDGLGRPMGVLDLLDDPAPLTNEARAATWEALLPPRLVTRLTKESGREAPEAIARALAAPQTTLEKAAQREAAQVLRRLARDVAEHADVVPPAAQHFYGPARDEEWRAFVAATRGLDDGTAGAELARREQAVARGEIVLEQRRARDEALAALETRIRELRRRDAAGAGTPVLNDRGRAWLQERLTHGGITEDALLVNSREPLTELAARTRAISAGLNAAVANRVSRFALELPWLPLRERVQLLGQARQATAAQAALRSVRAEEVAKLYNELDEPSLRLLGQAMAEGRSVESVVKESPQLRPLLDKLTGDAPDMLRLLEEDDDLLAGLIEAARSAGMIDDAMYSDMLSKGYDPQMHLHHELPARVRSKELTKLRQKGAVKGKRTAAGATPDELSFRRSLNGYRLRYGAGDHIEDHEFRTWAALKIFARDNWGERLSGLLEKPDGVARVSTKLGEDVTVSSPLGKDFLDTITDPAKTPFKRVQRIQQLSRDVAIIEYLDALRLNRGLVLDDADVFFLKQKHGDKATKVLNDYVRLPENTRKFGKLAGAHVHQAVIKEIEAASRSHGQMEAWVQGIRDAFTSEGTELPAVLLAQGGNIISRMHHRLNRAFRMGQIALSVGTRVANRAFGWVSDFVTGADIWSARNLDLAKEAARLVGYRSQGRLRGPLPQAFREFVEQGLHDQAYFSGGAASQAEIRAIDRMIGLDDIDLARARRLYDRAQKKLRTVLQAGPGADTRAAELEALAARGVVEELEQNWLRRAGRDIAAFFGNNRQRAIQSRRRPLEKFSDWAKASYASVDNMNKYRIFAALRRKGLDADSAAAMVRGATQQYANLPPALHRIQQSPIGAVVVGFPWELGRIMLNQAKHNGLRLGALAALMPALNFSMAAAGGTSPDRFFAHLQTMSGGSRLQVMKQVFSNLNFFVGGEHLQTIDFGNLFFPMAQMITGENALRHIADTFILEDETKRGIGQEVVAAGISAVGAFAFNTPLANTTLAAIGIDPRTGRRTYDEGGDFWEKGYAVFRAGANAYFSPETPILGRGWRSIRDAYMVGLDPTTGRPIGQTPVSAALRMLTGIGSRGVLNAAAEKEFGAALTAVTTALTAPGQPPPPGQLEGERVSDDARVWRNVVAQVARQERKALVENVLASHGLAEKQLYARAVKESDPGLWERLAEKVAKPGGIVRIAGEDVKFLGATVTEVGKALAEMGDATWLDAYSVLDTEEKIAALVVADKQGVGLDTLRAAVRTLQFDLSGGFRAPFDPAKVRAAQTMLGLWNRGAASRLRDIDRGDRGVVPLLPWDTYWEIANVTAQAQEDTRALRENAKRLQRQVLGTPGRQAPR